MVQEIVHKNSSHRKINLSLEDRISINDVIYIYIYIYFNNNNNLNYIYIYIYKVC